MPAEAGTPETARASMDFLLATIGSHGDAHPFVGLGATLRARGHRVSIMLNAHFEELAQKAGLETIRLGTDEEYRQGVKHADLWRGHRAFKAVMGFVTPLMRQQYDLIAKRVVPGETIVVSSSLCLGARIAQDKLGFAMATVHLSPAVFRSVIDPPKLPGMFLPRWVPTAVVRKIYDVADKLVIDKIIGPPVNEVRESLGMPPVSGIFRDWFHSPDLVIGMFPEWFAPVARDWPKQTVLTGFPLWDERDLTDGLPAEVYEFLNAGQPPIVFTPGSAMWAAEDFFAAAVEACQRMGRRAILLSRHREHIPRDLPKTIGHWDFIPFSQLLPHAVALVHHGGIGSCSQALAAGVRQLIMPMAHDQLDNAARLARLGVAKVISPKRFRAAKIARVIDSLLEDRNCHVRAYWVSQWFKGQRPLNDTAQVLEKLGGRERSPEEASNADVANLPGDRPALVGDEASSQN